MEKEKETEKKKKKQGEKEVFQFYIYKLPIDRPAAVTGSSNSKRLRRAPRLKKFRRLRRALLFLGGQNTFLTNADTNAEKKFGACGAL